MTLASLRALTSSHAKKKLSRRASGLPAAIAILQGLYSFWTVYSHHAFLCGSSNSSGVRVFDILPLKIYAVDHKDCGILKCTLPNDVPISLVDCHLCHRFSFMDHLPTSTSVKIPDLHSPICHLLHPEKEGICSLEAQNKVLFESFWIHSREVAKNFTRPPWWTSNDGQAFRVPLVEGWRPWCNSHSADTVAELMTRKMKDMHGWFVLVS